MTTQASKTTQAIPSNHTGLVTSGKLLQCKCACGGAPGPSGDCAACRRKRSPGREEYLLQPKLAINRPGDRWEREADRVADRVMNLSEAHSPCDDASHCAQAKQERPQVQRMTPGGAGLRADAPPIVHDVLRSSGQPLPAATRAFMETRFGYEFGQVSIHSDQRAAQSAHAVQARAYTVGQDIVFGAQQYAPQTNAGRQLLAHELTHTVQQTGPVVQRTIGDGHDLTATRFSGIAVLEACFDNERTLQNGSTGTAVRLVQESLVAQGYALPLFGADGIFGDETEGVVRQFQIDAGAVLLDGIIGPETMQLLDMHDTGATAPTGPAARPVPAGAPASPAATGAVFSEEPSEQFAGYDASTAPNWLVVPANGRRRAAVAIAPAGARPAFTSVNPAVATVDVTPTGVVVTGVAHGTTEVHADEGGVTLDRLQVTVKDPVQFSVAFHYVCDSAVPPNCSNGTPSADEMRSSINRVWERQGNVRFTGGASTNVVAPGDLGAAVDWTSPAGGEWNTVTALGAGANYNVFRVWHYLQDGANSNDAANLGVNTLVGDNTCADGLGLAHETGHFLGLDHPDGFIMTPCGGRVDRRVSKAMVDKFNP